MTRALSPAATPALHKLKSILDLFNAYISRVDHRAISRGEIVPKHPLLVIIHGIAGLQVEEVLGAAPEILEVQPAEMGHGLEMLQDRVPGSSGHVDLPQVDVCQVGVGAQEEKQGIRRGPDAAKREAPQL